MVNYSTEAKSCFDWIIAITPIIISLAVASIGFFQYRINKHKFRLDLYNRRFAVYEKALLLFQAYYSNDHDQAKLDDCTKEFIRFYRESVFLFGLESDVYKRLTELKDTLVFLIRLQNESSAERSNTDVYNHMLKIKEEKRDPNEIMQDLEKALVKWLDFKNIQE